MSGITSLRTRPAVVIPLSFFVAFVAVTIVQRVAPVAHRDAVSLCVAWVAFYPISRLKPKNPWWWHWVEGVFIGLGFWAFTHFSH